MKANGFVRNTLTPHGVAGASVAPGAYTIGGHPPRALVGA
jgi:hypothetical protein